MNCRTRSSIRDGRRPRRRIGEKIRTLRIGFGRTRTYEKHPENFIGSRGADLSFRLSHQNHPICTFQNHRMRSDIQYLKNACLYYINRPCLCQFIRGRHDLFYGPPSHFFHSGFVCQFLAHHSAKLVKARPFCAGQLHSFSSCYLSLLP